MLKKDMAGIVRIIYYAIGTMLVMDLMTIISNIYIAPVLDGYGMPDVLIYVKTFIFLVLFVYMTLWTRLPEMELSKTRLKHLMTLSFVVLIAYFVSLYIYKYFLIADTAEVIRVQILIGNPALILDVSAENYTTLNYIISIYNGFNSELILFIEALVFQYLLYKLNSVETKEELTYEYDEFIFKPVQPWISYLHFIISFLTMNIIVFRYDLIGAFEMAFALALITTSYLALLASLQISKMPHNTVSKSAFVSNHRFMLVMIILNVIVDIVLIGIGSYLSTLGRGSYRFMSAILLLPFSIYLLYYAYRALKLENK